MATLKYDTTTGTYILVDYLFVTTDYADYAPGATAMFTAYNVNVGGTVEFSVGHLDPGADGIVGTADDGLTHDLMGTMASWTVTDGGIGDLDGLLNGSVQTSWDVNQDALHQTFVLTATDGTGSVATASFTDALETNLRPAGSTT